jgi:hypothetical protein
MTADTEEYVALSFRQLNTVLAMMGVEVVAYVPHRRPGSREGLIYRIDGRPVGHLTPQDGLTFRRCDDSGKLTRHLIRAHAALWLAKPGA